MPLPQLRQMRPYLLILLLTLPPATHAAEVSVAFQQGEVALSSGLWEIAARRFETLLQDPSLEIAKKSQVAVCLAEAWIRSGNTAEALNLLRQSVAAKDPAANFWKAQALAASGHLAEAITTFDQALENPQTPYRKEALLSRANLQLALNQSAAALLTLKTLASDSDPATAAQARLRQTEILLDLGDPQHARASMPMPETIAPAGRSHAAFLEARLLLAEGKPEAAVEAFAELLDHPEGQALTRHHAAAIGLADALAAQGSPASASKSLLSFIQAHPASPLLDAMFKRLLQWLPAAPTPTDPMLEQLAQWIPPLPPPAASVINTRGTSVIAAWPAITELSDLAAFALYTRAIGLHRLKSPEAKVEANHLMTRLRLENPNHFLASRALLQTGRWLLEQGHTKQAIAVLAAVRETANAPALGGEAAFLSAQAAFADGDGKQAVRLFDAATKSLAAEAADAARLNAAIVRLHQGESLPIATHESPAMSPGTLADLELEQALATTPPAVAKTALETFLTRHPEHTRCAEARLAAVEAALSTNPPDLFMARAQLDALGASQASIDAPSPARIALARLRSSDLSDDPKATIAAARAFLESFPNEPTAADAALVLGRNLFQSGDYNPARMTLEKCAAIDTTPTRAQAAWLLAARSAALVPSPQSREEALILFERAITTKGPLAPIARLEKARLMIDLSHLADAVTFLRKWHSTLAKDDPLRLPAGFLLGESLTAQADKKPELLPEVLDLYQKLLTHPKMDPATRHRLQYLRGQTLEQLPNPKDPSTKRVAEALEAYYSVLEAAAKEPPAEWEWFERCGFRALEIYEAAHRWQPAIAIAKKIAAFKGPRADEAAALARALQLKHMVWED
ncbi:MAG: tetratricopeptide repeat protein [Verrucomicrobiota bacterium]